MGRPKMSAPANARARPMTKRRFRSDRRPGKGRSVERLAMKTRSSPVDDPFGDDPRGTPPRRGAIMPRRLCEARLLNAGYSLFVPPSRALAAGQGALAGG